MASEPAAAATPAPATPTAVAAPAPAAPTQTQLSLPTSIVTPADIGRLLRELEQINAHLFQLKVRTNGGPIALPAITSGMQHLTEHNKLNLLHPGDRNVLNNFLLSVKDKAPLLHISFSTEPTPTFLVPLIAWLRREISPMVLFTIGLQPAIGAGCVVRTANKYFDLSLRQTFVRQRPLLLAQIIPPGPEVIPS
jgi:hypothetical protein